MRAQRWIWVLWPAFLLACALEVLVFALLDPADLSWRGRALGASPQAIYTISFFVFWLLASASNALSLLLMQSAKQINNPHNSTQE